MVKVKQIKQKYEMRKIRFRGKNDWVNNAEVIEDNGIEEGGEE